MDLASVSQALLNITFGEASITYDSETSTWYLDWVNHVALTGATDLASAQTAAENVIRDGGKRVISRWIYQGSDFLGSLAVYA